MKIGVALLWDDRRVLIERGAERVMKKKKQKSDRNRNCVLFATWNEETRRFFVLETTHGLCLSLRAIP